MRRFFTTLVVAAAALLVAEGMARALPPSPLHCSLTDRNPAVRYGWPGWTAPRPRPEEQELVVVISNSQGFAPELDDPSRTWPAQLERRLLAGGERAVYNWSLNAARGPELAVLAAAAGRHAPDLVLVVAGSGTFGQAQATWRVGFRANDLKDMLADPAVAGRLPGGLAEELRRKVGLRWTDHLRARSGLVRLRDRLPLLEKGIAQVAQEAPEDIASAGATGAVGEAGDALLDGLVQAAGAPVLFVGQPLGPGASEMDRAARDVFIERTAARWGSPGSDLDAAVLDAADAVAPSRFLSLTHLDAAGHRDFADWLAPHVAAALAR